MGHIISKEQAVFRDELLKLKPGDKMSFTFTEHKIESMRCWALHLVKRAGFHIKTKCDGNVINIVAYEGAREKSKRVVNVGLNAHIENVISNEGEHFIRYTCTDKLNPELLRSRIKRAARKLHIPITTKLSTEGVIVTTGARIRHNDHNVKITVSNNNTGRSYTYTRFERNPSYAVANEARRVSTIIKGSRSAHYRKNLRPQIDSVISGIENVGKKFLTIVASPIETNAA